MGDAMAELEQIRIIIRDAKPPLPARIIQRVTQALCVVLLAILCAIGVPRLFGIQEFNVLTGSMTPGLPVGSLVYVARRDPASIKPGEIVSFVMNKELDVATHRVVRNDYAGKRLVTKGDANNNEDEPIMYENVIGTVAFSVPYAGAVFDYFANDDQGRVVGAAILICILVLVFAADIICSALTRQRADVLQGEKSQARPKERG